MELFDAKKLWIEGGYGINNPYEIFLTRVNREANARSVSQNDLTLILIDFFIELRKEPKKYRTKNNECVQCPCNVFNSGTNATHYICKKIQEKQVNNIKIAADVFSKSLNEKLNTYVKEYGPGKGLNLYPEAIIIIIFIFISIILRMQHGF